MPELPEVETIRRGLEPALEGARLERVEQRRSDLRFPLPERFAERLTGAQVKRLTRRAKYLLVELDQGETWVTHLGMTGRFTVERKPTGRSVHAAPAATAHEHLVFETDRDARIGFADPRRFGYMALIPSGALDEHPWFRALGPEPLGNSFSAHHLETAFAGRAQNVKATLLDQRVVAGLGNIYVCEALHRAKISPVTPAGRIGARPLAALATAVREVLEEAIEAGGSTLRDYADANGGQGYFQHNFRVYGREGEPCARPRCAGMVERIVQAGRSTFFCGTCQR
jgi:formamidopyrimidine-DNA glycosylase